MTRTMELTMFGVIRVLKLLRSEAPDGTHRPRARTLARLRARRAAEAERRRAGRHAPEEPFERAGEANGAKRA